MPSPPAHPASRSASLRRCRPIAAGLLSLSLGWGLQPAGLHAQSAADLPEIKLPTLRSIAPAPSDPNRFIDLFRPARTDLATLSPDGRYLAYSLREDDQLSVMVVATDHLDIALTKVAVVNDQLATPRFARHEEKTPAAINWMKWVGNNQLVVETNAQVATSSSRSVPGTILTFGADGHNARILLTGRDVPELISQIDPVASTARDYSPLTANVDDPFYSAGGAAAARASARSEDPTIDGGLFDAGTRLNLFGGQDSDVIDPETGIGTLPLSPSVFDLDPADPQRVLVRTVSSAYLVLYGLDVTTGKAKQRADYPIDADHQLMLDRQGVPRISAPGSTTFAFPHRLALERGSGARADQTLAAMAGLPADAFDTSPANYFGHRAVPIGFDEDPSVLYFASNIGRDTYGIYAVNLATGQRTDFALEHPKLDLIPRPLDAFLAPGTLVFDRYTRALKGVRLSDRINTTRWLDPLLQSVQSLLEKTLPNRSVDILEWDQAGQKLLVFAHGITSPGEFYLFDRTTRQLTQFAARAPWLSDLATNRVISFTVETADHHDVPCQLTLPQNPRVMPAPILVVCPSNPWDRVLPEFQPEVQALARMGFAVVQPAARGAWGYGVKAREAIHNGYDAAQISDLIAVVDELGKAFNLDTKRVGLIGSGWGGYVALRAMALHPARFRCAVTLEPPVDLGKWLGREDWTSRDTGLQLVRSYYGPQELLEAKQLSHEADLITKPVLLLSYPGPDGSWRRDTFTTGRNFIRSLHDTSPESEFMELTHDFAKGLPIAQSTTYREIELFLNTHVYNFGVSIGESVEVKDGSN